MIEKLTSNEITIVVPSIEHAYMVMNIAEHMNCIIQKYYWRSKFDKEYIVEIEPKIDAFDVVIILRGDITSLGGVHDIYMNKKDMLDKLPKNTAMSEKDIQRYSFELLRYAEIL